MNEQEELKALRALKAARANNDQRAELEALRQLKGVIGSNMSVKSPSPIKERPNAVDRQLGLTARYVSEGLSEAADVFTNPIRYGLNQLGLNIPSTSDAVKSQLTSLPQPEGKLENIVGTTSKFLSSGTPFLKSAQVASKVPGIVGQAGRAAAANPAIQGVTMASSGAGGEIAKQEGVGPAGQFAASLASGLTPTGVQYATKSASKLLNNAQINKLLKKSAPTVDELKNASVQIYQEIDDMGVTVQSRWVDALANRVAALTKKKGIHPKVTPAAHAALEEVINSKGKNLTLTEIENLREIAKNAAASTNKKEAMLGSDIADAIDDALDGLSHKFLISGNAEGLGQKYAQARNLWGRMRRSELIERAIEKARHQDSGFENGMRVQIRQIINNDKKSKFFNKEELAALRAVVDGDFRGNMARLIGKLGFSEGRATQLIGGSLGVGAGAYAGGPGGAVAVPLVGQVSKALVRRLTGNRARFAQDVIKAGKDWKRVVSAYMRNTPKAQRDPQELKELLMRPEINLPADVDQVVSNIIPIDSVRKAVLPISYGIAAAQSQ